MNHLDALGPHLRASEAAGGKQPSTPISNSLARAWAALLVVALAACAPSASASPSEPPIPSATPVAPPSSTPQPTPFGAALFPEPNDCNATGDSGYRIAYPGEWHANVGVAGVPDCSLFGPEPIQTEADPGIAIRVIASPPGSWSSGPITQSFDGITVLVDEETQLGDRPGWVREFERTDEADPLMDMGDRWIRYEVALPNDWLVTVATTGHPAGAGYDAVKEVARAMATSIEQVDR
jgi:hypothetical protein